MIKHASHLLVNFTNEYIPNQIEVPEYLKGALNYILTFNDEITIQDMKQRAEGICEIYLYIKNFKNTNVKGVLINPQNFFASTLEKQLKTANIEYTYYNNGSIYIKDEQSILYDSKYS